MIKPVYRVQCDGPGKEWLSLPDGYIPGTVIVADAMIAVPTAERAGNWPTEEAARRTAVAAGWHLVGAASKLVCPGCQVRLYMTQHPQKTSSEEPTA